MKQATGDMPSNTAHSNVVPTTVFCRKSTKRQSVHFEQIHRDNVHFVPALSEMDEAHRSAVWWKEGDLKRMRLQSTIIAVSMRRGCDGVRNPHLRYLYEGNLDALIREQDGEEDVISVCKYGGERQPWLWKIGHSSRGLEKLLEPGRVKRSKNLVLAGVLREQERQFLLDEPCDTNLATISRRRSRSLCRWAYDRAMQDETIALSFYGADEIANHRRFHNTACCSSTATTMMKGILKHDSTDASNLTRPTTTPPSCKRRNILESDVLPPCIELSTQTFIYGKLACMCGKHAATTIMDYYRQTCDHVALERVSVVSL